MAKFICRNDKCCKFGIVDEYFSNTYKMVNGKLISKNAICPKCGEIREEVDESVPLSKKDIFVAKYSSLSPEDKKEVLKKRSHEHYEKEIKPYKEHQLHEVVKQFNKK